MRKMQSCHIQQFRTDEHEKVNVVIAEVYNSI